jgi:hypothetical protein
MENGIRHSVKLFGAAFLTLCGLAAVAVGAGIGVSPSHTQICGSSVVVACCPEASASPETPRPLPPARLRGRLIG